VAGSWVVDHRDVGPQRVERRQNGGGLVEHFR
jgi:hypothetical protein